MKNNSVGQRKLYAMQRMGAALDRAMAESSNVAKERAAKWAAAWGLLCGIRSRKVALRPARDVVLPKPDKTALEFPCGNNATSSAMESKGNKQESSSAGAS